MSIFNWFKKRHVFDDEDRRLSYERRNRKLQLDIQRMEDDARILRARADREEARLKMEMSEYLGADDENDIGKLLIQFMPVLQKAFPQVFANLSNLSPLLGKQETTPVSNPVLVSYPDEELKEMRNKIPKHYLKVAKDLPDDKLKEIIKTNFLSNADEDSLNRAVSLIR